MVKLRRPLFAALALTSGSFTAFGCNASAFASSTRVGTPVLGQKGFDGPGATGWGTYKPTAFFNGGDPSGHVVGVTWKHWGHRTTTGTGRGYIFMQKSGYYPGSVKVDVRAFDLGHCTSSGPLAYERLDVRYPSRPGGRLGRWTHWSGSLCVTTSISTTTQPAGSAAPPCRDDQISVSVAGGGAGLGHQDQVIAFTNQSPSTCSLSGYPGVAGLDAQGHQVVQAERTPNGYLGGLWNGATTPPTVTIAPGQTASATVEGTDNPVGAATSCPSYSALLVTPPNCRIHNGCPPHFPVAARSRCIRSYRAATRGRAEGSPIEPSGGGVGGR